MELDFGDVLTQVFGGTVGVFSFISGSFLFQAFKLFMLVYVVVLFVDIVLLFALRGFSSDLKATLYGSARPFISRNKAITRWEGMLRRLESGNPSQYKVAVLEADALADEVLSGIGLGGDNMADRLDKITDSQIETKPLLTEAHLLRNRIISEPELLLSFETAQEALMKYKKFFDEVELF
jgi:hypothetical protein